ncbi:hypothetical protein IMPERIA75_700596 [Imperialibacter sp. 75]|nr:hypothetical protein IMPERIA75_700596 [Imperialibacter sp. 75]
METDSGSSVNKLDKASCQAEPQPEGSVSVQPVLKHTDINNARGNRSEVTTNKTNYK